MAYTPEQWVKAKGLFEAGKSLSYINKMLGIGKTTISDKAKEENWQKGKTEQTTEQLKTLIIDAETRSQEVTRTNRTITEQLINSDFEDYQIEVLEDLVKDTCKQKNILFTGLNMAMIRATQKLQQNRKKELLKIKEGFGNGISQEHYEEIESDLSSSDIQDYTNVLIKAGQGLGIIEKDGSQVSIQNNIQNNNTALTLEQAEKEALALGVPLEVLLR